MVGGLTMPQDSRKIWACQRGGVVIGYAWAHTEADALALVPGDAATATRWRRVPRPLRLPAGLDAALCPRVEGDRIVCGGCEWLLADKGTLRADGCEPDAPEGRLVDPDKAAALSDALAVLRPLQVDPVADLRARVEELERRISAP